MGQIKTDKPPGELYYKDSLDDFRKRALWSQYRMYNWFRLFSVIAVAIFAGVAILTAQITVFGPDVVALAIAMGIGLGLALGFAVAATFTRRRGRKLESRVEEFKRNKNPYPEWKQGKFGRK